MNKVIIGYADISQLTEADARARAAEVSEYRRRDILKQKTRKGAVQSFGAGFLLETMLAEQGISDREFLAAAGGKPYLNCNLFFNVSHSENMVLCALSHSEIGCDVEKIRAVRQGALSRVFSPREREYIGSDPERFFRLWTIKESYIKYKGASVLSLRADSVEINTDTEKPFIFGAPQTLITGNLGDYVFALCGDNIDAHSIAAYNLIF